ncbi:MAG: hypothetical protein QN174_07785 [Armatimonadota bacterium]|nr:hypothetical protein [Armatimonadota bacterium]
MAFRDLLVHRATLEQATITRSETGEEVEAWVTRYRDVPGLLRFARGGSADVPLGMEQAVTHIWLMEPLDDLRAGRWRLLVDGREYMVSDVTDAAGRGHHYDVRLRRLG